MSWSSSTTKGGCRLKGHPRITRYAIMKETRVARAWNVGIEMAATPHVFILNADCTGA